MGESDRTSSDSDFLVWIIILVGAGALAWMFWPREFGSHQPSLANACINNLRQIDGAKNEWALETGKTNLDLVVTEADIKPYIKLNQKGEIPKCPAGGKYTIGKLNEPPTCSIGSNDAPAHVLP